MRAIIFGGAGALALVLAGSVAAVADSGDGLVGCNSYEICFSRDADNNRYQKHYYGSDSDHSNNYFWDTQLNSQTGSKLEDNAYKLRNRDGSCYVRVTDWNGAFPSTTTSRTTAHGPYSRTASATRTTRTRAARSHEDGMGGGRGPRAGDDTVRLSL